MKARMIDIEFRFMGVVYSLWPIVVGVGVLFVCFVGAEYIGMADLHARADRKFQILGMLLISL